MNAHPVFAVLAILILTLTGWTFAGLRHEPGRRRAAWLAGLRFASAILLAWIMFQPRHHRSVTVPERPLIGVLVDASQSMNDGPPSATRATVAREWLDSAAFREATESFDFRYFAIDGKLTESIPGGIAFNGTESRIKDALSAWTRRWGREDAVGMVLISDGLDTGSGPAESLDLPCWVMEVEPPSATASSRITVWQVEPPRRAVAGSENSVRVVLQGWGVDGRDIPVELWRDGKKILEKPARFDRRGEVVEVRLPLKAEQPGSYAYELRIADPAADPAAKSQPFVITVRQEGRNVLMLSNAIVMEGKFLRRALTTDRNVRLDSYARWQDGRWASLGDGTGPARESLDLDSSSLATRSAVILADVTPDALNPLQWQALATFVDQGGGLAILGGPNLLASPRAAESLGRLLPVPTPAPHHDGRFGVRLTDAGLRHPVFGPLFESVKDFPALQGVNSSTGVAGNAQVLMEAVSAGQARPLVVVKQQGTGRVAVVMSDTLWRWRVAAPGWTGRMSAYDTFWSQLLDWLAPDQEGLQGSGRIELTTDKPFYRQGDKVMIQAEWIGKGDAPFSSLTVSLADPTGKTASLELPASVWQNAEGRRVAGFRGEVTAAHTGIYEVAADAEWDGGEAREQMRFAVAASPEERRGESPDAELLRQIATQSGGAYFARGDGERWLDSLPESKRESVREIVTDIWNHPLAAVLLLGSLCGEWWLRRRSGLA